MGLFWRRFPAIFCKVPSVNTRWIKVVVFCFVLCYTCFFAFPLALHGEKFCTRLLSEKTELWFYYSQFLRCMSEESSKEFFKQRIRTSNLVITFVGDERHYWRFQSLQSVFDKNISEDAPPKMCFYRQDYLNSTLLARIKWWTTGNSSVSRNRTSKAGGNCIDMLPTHLVLGFPLISCCADGWRIAAKNTAEIQKNFVTILHRLRNVRLILVTQDCSDNWCRCKNRLSVTREQHFHIAEDMEILNSLKNISFFRASRSIAYARGLRNTKLKCDDGQNSTSNTRSHYKAATLDGRLLPYALFDIGSECCTFTPNLNVIQKRLFILFSSVTLLALVLHIASLCCRFKSTCLCVYTLPSTDETRYVQIGRKVFNMLLEFSTSMSKFGLILLYFFLRHQTTIYEGKYFQCTFWMFMLPVLSFLLIGVVSVRPSKTNTFNSVDITQEWKGWMQLYIVMYHYLPGCNTTLAIGRIVVSAYLFLTGYGHFCYYWRRKSVNYAITGLLKLRCQDVRNFGKAMWQDAQRYLTVMFRLNLLFIAICLTENEGLHRHYYMQLATTWYTALTVVMICYPRISSHGLQNQVASEANESLVRESDKVSNDNIMSDWGNHEQNRTVGDITNPLNQGAGQIKVFNVHQCHRALIYAVFLGKLVPLACVAEWMCRNRALFDKIFFSGPWKNYFNSDPNHWHYRFKNDAYTAVYGAVFALACQMYLGTQIKQNTPTTESRCSSTTFRRLSPLFNKIDKIIAKMWKPWLTSVVVTALGGLALAISLKVYYQCTTEKCVFDLNRYICFVPILGYIAMRNGLVFMRNHCSTFFVRLGYISMEMYILHQTNTRPKLILYFPVHDIFNGLIDALILLCMCDEIHQLTASLDKYFVPKTASEILWKSPMALFIYCFLTYKI